MKNSSIFLQFFFLQKCVGKLAECISKKKKEFEKLLSDWKLVKGELVLNIDFLQYELQKNIAQVHSEFEPLKTKEAVVEKSKVNDDWLISHRFFGILIRAIIISKWPFYLDNSFFFLIYGLFV